VVTIKDIARECGVSIATVSNVLNGKNKAGADTQAKILETIKKYDYKPNKVAKGLRSRKTGIIGIIVEDLSQFTSPGIVEGITRYIEQFGYKAILINMRLYSRWSDSWFNNESMLDEIIKQSLDDLSAIMVDGIIYVAVHAREVHKIPESMKIPAVMVYSFEENPNVASVVIDDEKSAYEEVKYLLEKGHREIGIIGGREDNLHTQFRMKGALRALSEYGIEQKDDRICYALWNKEEGYNAMKAFSEKGLTAVFCMTDRMAGGVYQYAHEYNISIGRELSVAGYDNQMIAEYLDPMLTTMALPLDALGESAAKILMSELKGTDCDVELVDGIYRIPCTFKERESVADIDV